MIQPMSEKLQGTEFDKMSVDDLKNFMDQIDEELRKARDLMRENNVRLSDNLLKVAHLAEIGASRFDASHMCRTLEVIKETLTDLAAGLRS